MVACLGTQEQVPSLQDVDACSWGHSVEELDLDGVDELFSELKSDLIQIAKLTLDEEKELVMQERGGAGHKESAFSVLFVTQRDEALAVIVVDTLVDQEVLTDHDDSTRAVVARNLDEHVRRVVHWEDVLSNHVVQPEIHLIES